ncbi:hypothetical protein QQX98_004584 [Neonectria punicea]|uniref:C2H2-type domain-containing protein n=1 Tax=Neonectria punicea TaxID=979145 RepID=A0ABR1H8T6_9HYPO
MPGGSMAGGEDQVEDQGGSPEISDSHQSMQEGVPGDVGKVTKIGPERSVRMKLGKNKPPDKDIAMKLTVRRKDKPRIPCPLYRHNPAESRQCRTFEAPSVADVLHHILQVHGKLVFCSKCKAVFNSPASESPECKIQHELFELHLRRKACQENRFKISDVAEYQLDPTADLALRQRSTLPYFENSVRPFESASLLQPNHPFLCPALVHPGPEYSGNDVLAFEGRDFPRFEDSMIETGICDATSSTGDSRYAKSIFSETASETSQTSQSYRDHVKPAREVLVDLLIKDAVLERLLATGAADSNIGVERLAVNFRRMLIMYSEELLQLADTIALKEAGKLVRSSSGYLSAMVRTQFGSSSEHPLQELARPMTKQERLEKEKRLGQYIRSLDEAERREVSDLRPDRGYQVDGDDDDYDERTITSALQHIKEFLQSGEPMENLRERLRGFVTPDIQLEICSTSDSDDSTATLRISTSEFLMREATKCLLIIKSPPPNLTTAHRLRLRVASILAIGAACSARRDSS